MKNPPLILPFTNHRLFYQSPRMVTSASGMYYKKDNGELLLDATSGLWCVNAGHCRASISDAIAQMARKLDYAPAFQMGHEASFELAERLSHFLPPSLHHIFFTSSGSEAVETAIKIALQYHQLSHPEQKEPPIIVARDKGYHGVCLGGLAAGGITNNRIHFEKGLLLRTEFIRAFDGIEDNLMTKNLRPHGIERADDLLGIIEKYGAESIAALIIEPVSGSAGVLVPPDGYLERIASHCKIHNIPLILDEVITAFGRLGANTAATRFNLEPDLLCSAKGLTNGAVPMGMVGIAPHIIDLIMSSSAHDYAIEFPHGFTYSGHPLACAAALATLDIYEEEKLFERARSLEDFFADSIHQLQDFPIVVDVRSIGLMAAIELAPTETPSTRAFEIYRRLFDKGLLVRTTGDTIALSPPLIVSKEQITEMTDKIATELKKEEA